MRRSWKVLATASAFAAAALAATALYADGRHDRSGHKGSGGMMSKDAMMGQRNQMMDHCKQMMGGPGSGRPNEQWRK